MWSKVLSVASKVGKGLLKSALSGFSPISLIEQTTNLISDVLQSKASNSKIISDVFGAQTPAFINPPTQSSFLGALASLPAFQQGIQGFQNFVQTPTMRLSNQTNMLAEPGSNLINQQQGNWNPDLGYNGTARGNFTLSLREELPIRKGQGFNNPVGFIENVQPGQPDVNIPYTLNRAPQGQGMRNLQNVSNNLTSDI